MFANLRQGNLVYVLEQSDNLTLKPGKIIENKSNYTGSMDMRLKVGDNEYELKQLPYNQIIAKNGSLVISENLNSVLDEVRRIKSDCENRIKNIDYDKLKLLDCDAILRQYDASYDKELRIDEEIDSLKLQNTKLTEQINSITLSLSNIEKLLSNKNN